MPALQSTSFSWSPGMQTEITRALNAFAQDIANTIEKSYVDVALNNARTLTSTMFEALAGGALVADRASRSEVSETTRALATIAALEGRPSIMEQIAVKDFIGGYLRPWS